jgi:hypothetical protein
MAKQVQKAVQNKLAEQQKTAKFAPQRSLNDVPQSSSLSSGTSFLES